jgi:hypothetical protein
MKELVGDEVVIRPWLQSFPLRVTKGFGPKYIQTQIIASNDAGGTGWLLWSPGNHYTYSYEAMQNIPKPKPVAHNAGTGTKIKEPKQPSPAKNSSPSGPPVGVTQQPVTGPRPGAKT